MPTPCANRRLYDEFWSGEPGHVGYPKHLCCAALHPTFKIILPPWYVGSTPTNDEQNIASMFWGFTLGVGLWSGVKGYRQSRASWNRTHRVNIYIWLIWAEWIASIVIGIISWCYLTSIIDPSRIVDDPATRLKWGVFGILLAVNISVFCIWIPARLQINETYIHINEIWDRIEKGIFLLVDAGLNLTFIYLVKSRLIASGLTKYTALFRFNLAMTAVSMSLDVILIGLMSLPNTLIYAQFHPLAYLLKLHIEMGMADLIAKVVKASNPMRPHAETRRDSTEGAPDANKNSLSKSRSRRFSMPYVAGRWMLSSENVQPKRNTVGPELELGMQADTFSGRAAEPETTPHPRSLSRHITEPNGIPGLGMTPQSRTSRQDSSSTVREQDQDVAWYV
ncbi:uncharacterized protein CLUP02_04257 [Colletotrichum lupini]|uniref:Integral membrane protein n=1 Tax=Colletotrichum lupini TaxID=145971 RepID=A0A9Q8SKE9_9PEZI|nr:uncharacterized protein CLUP02_04257 [Colletotrichum lupini]UQC78780.1 hypothetical protein CLUP02_04257 [Colletotrichum lupini]